jgi:hypothetical protein
MKYNEMINLMKWRNQCILHTDIESIDCCSWLWNVFLFQYGRHSYKPLRGLKVHSVKSYGYMRGTAGLDRSYQRDWFGMRCGVKCIVLSAGLRIIRRRGFVATSSPVRGLHTSPAVAQRLRWFNWTAFPSLFHPCSLYLFPNDILLQSNHRIAVLARTLTKVVVRWWWWW